MSISRLSLVMWFVIAVGFPWAAAPAAEQAEVPLTLTLPATAAQPDPELARFSHSLARLADSLRPALVQVRRIGQGVTASTEGEPRQDREPPRRGLGSGFIVSSQGHIVTNHHVVSGGGVVEVRLQDGRRFPARILGSDARTDLAVLKVDGLTNPAVMPLGDSDALQVGELVMALGNPFGLEQTVSLGIISRKPRRAGVAGPGFEFIQTDAAVNPGNSGGPLVNMAGEVVGVNSMATSRGSIGFAIPSRVVQAVGPVLVAHGKMTWGWLGVAVGEVDDVPSPVGTNLQPQEGVLIRGARAGDPAARAGIREGDILVAVDGVPVREPRDLQQIVAGLAPGKRVPLNVVRAGKPETLIVEIGEAPGDVQ